MKVIQSHGARFSHSVQVDLGKPKCFHTILEFNGQHLILKLHLKPALSNEYRVNGKIFNYLKFGSQLVYLTYAAFGKALKTPEFMHFINMKQDFYFHFQYYC